eukprot:scaffold245289_cov35-Tisochrysis_lutea.AAC.1
MQGCKDDELLVHNFRAHGGTSRAAILPVYRSFLPRIRNERNEMRAPAGTRPTASPAIRPASGPMPEPVDGGAAEGLGMVGTLTDGTDTEGTAIFGAEAAATLALSCREALAASRCALALAFCSAAACSAARRCASFLLNGGGGEGDGGGRGGEGGSGASFLARTGRSFFSALGRSCLGSGLGFSAFDLGSGCAQRRGLY